MPLPPRCTGWRRRWMPLLVFPERNWPELFFSRFLVKTVYCGQRFVEVRTISHQSDFSRFIERDPPILYVSKVLIFRHSIGEIFLRVHVYLDADLFSLINAVLRFTEYRIFLEAIVNPFESSFWCISFSNYGQHGVLFVLQSSHCDGHEVAHS